MIGWFALGILFLLSGIVYLGREIQYISRIKKLQIISYVRLMYSVSFGFAAALLCFTYSLANQKLQLGNLVVMEYGSEALQNLFIFWLLSVIGYLALSFGYGLIGERKVSIKTNYHGSREFSISEFQMFCIALIGLLIGAFSLHMWTKDLGGVFDFIPLASGIRGDYLNSYGNTHTAWRRPASICLPASYLFYFMALGKDAKHRLRNGLLCVLSIMAALLYLLCNDGRLTIALYFVILIIGFFSHSSVKIKNPKKLIIRLFIIAGIAAVLLAKLDDITYFIRHQQFRTIVIGSDTNIISTLMEEFLFIYKSGVTSIKVTVFGDGKLQIVNDLVLGITAYLPSRFDPEGYLSVWRYNTALCTGSNSAIIGTIPCDMISFSVYDLGLIGIFIIPFLIGAAISLIEGHFRRKERDAYHLTMYYGFVLVFFRLVSYCQLSDFMIGMFPYLLIYVIAHGVMLLNVNKRRVSRHKRF